MHTVDLGKLTGMPSCTCLDWIKNHNPCKHMFAIFEHNINWSWNDLPPQYLSQPHLCADMSALNAHFSVADNISDANPQMLTTIHLLVWTIFPTERYIIIHTYYRFYLGT